MSWEPSNARRCTSIAKRPLAIETAALAIPSRRGSDESSEAVGALVAPSPG